MQGYSLSEDKNGLRRWRESLEGKEVEGSWFAHPKVKERRLCGGGGNRGVMGEEKHGHREAGMILPINVNHQIVLSNRKEGPY